MLLPSVVVNPEPRFDLRTDMGWNQQQSLDYAVEEVEKQAAKVGANVLVFTDRETETQVVDVPTYGGGTTLQSLFTC